MTRYILTTATAALFAGASVLPALAAAHADLNSMTCADFQALDQEQQQEVAAMAVAEQSSGGAGSMVGSLRADEPDSAEGVTTEAEADDAQDTTLVPNEGTATATDGGPDVGDKSVRELDMEALMRACDRNLDAMVLEAAAGMDTSR